MDFSKVSIDLICDGLPGITYVIDLHGKIVYYGKKAWNRFALDNDEPNLVDASNVINKSIFDFIDGDEVKDIYRLYHQVLLQKRLNQVNFFYNCDSPDMVRDMFLSISPISMEGEIVGFLYHSLVLKEQLRPPVSLFTKRDNDSLPIITICSFCKRIDGHNKVGSKGWVTAEKYYQLGGSSQVSLSHGICPDCIEKHVYSFQVFT